MKPTKEMFDDARALHVGRVAAYSRGEMSDAAFRPVRLSYGLYYQLDHTSYMQRIKLPGGLMTVEQMQALADVTDAYERGAAHTVRLARAAGAEGAVLKARSPSCGCHQVYDGTFSRTRVPGEGVTARALRAAGFPVCDEEDVESAAGD